MRLQIAPEDEFYVSATGRQKHREPNAKILERWHKGTASWYNGEDSEVAWNVTVKIGICGNKEQE